MRYILDRTVFGWCWWDLIALIVLVCVCVYCYRKVHKMKELKKELEERLENQMAGQSVPEEPAQ